MGICNSTVSKFGNPTDFHELCRFVESKKATIKRNIHKTLPGLIAAGIVDIYTYKLQFRVFIFETAKSIKNKRVADVAIYKKWVDTAFVNLNELIRNHGLVDSSLSEDHAVLTFEINISKYIVQSEVSPPPYSDEY